MSAYIVSKPTMDLTLEAIRSAGKFEPFDKITEDVTLTAIGRRLFEMNLEALTQRYPGETKESAPGPCDTSDIHGDYCYTESVPGAATNGWILGPGENPGRKALRELRYQCSEGDVPDTWPEYQALDNLIESSS